MPTMRTRKTNSNPIQGQNKEYQYCLRCGRKLKNEEARLLGMGKVCAEKSKHDTRRRLFDANCDT